jgi:hypothetical protein
VKKDDPIEAVPAGEVLSVCTSFSIREMVTARDFERLVDHRLARLKEMVMQQYRDRRPPPFPVE